MDAATWETGGARVAGIRRRYVRHSGDMSQTGYDTLQHTATFVGDMSQTGTPKIARAYECCSVLQCVIP